MNNKEMIDKYSITKKTGVLILLQILKVKQIKEGTST